jgi:DNA-3-methyladenine glycosylase II
MTIKLATKPNLKEAEDYLSKTDPLLKVVIAKYGDCQLEPHKDYYGALVQSIIGQQLSVKAAHAIGLRFMALFGNKLPSPKQISLKSHDELRAVGLSNSKVNYVRDLADKILAKELDLEKIGILENDQIVEELTKVKGIGVWTSHMFLVFCVGRLDVLPIGDLGIRKGIQNLYGLNTLPSSDEVTEIGISKKWHPYESVASWYVWKSLDNK